MIVLNAPKKSNSNFLGIKQSVLILDDKYITNEIKNQFENDESGIFDKFINRYSNGPLWNSDKR